MTGNSFLDPNLRDEFLRNGFVRVPLLDRSEVERLLATYRSTDSGMSVGFYTTLWSRNLEYRKRVADEVGGVLTPRLKRYFSGGRLVLTQFAVKRGGQPESSQCPLHQDWSFVDERRHQAVSLWCPLVDITLENGPLAVVPGSHRASEPPRPNYATGEDYQQFRPLFPLLREKYARELCLSAGECLLYDGAIVHSSRPNHSNEDRVVVVAVIIPDGAQLRHYWRPSRDAVEAFDVDEDFFLTEVEVGRRPNREPSEVLEAPFPSTPMTEDEFLARTSGVDREPAGSTPVLAY